MQNVLCLYNNHYQLEHAYNIYDFPFNKLWKPKRDIKNYLGHLMTFDIETSTVNQNEKHVGFMYHWQICLDGYVCFGRTWQEFILFIKKTIAFTKAKSNKKLVCYVHNLSYEFHFIYRFFKITDVFAVDSHKVIKCVLDDCIELRCSYFLSNMNLKKFIENTPNAHYQKGVGDLDYSKIITPDISLTLREKGYCYNDVRGLYEAVLYLLNEDTLQSIPITSTGYVRRECRKNVNNNPKNREIFLDSQLTEEQYQLCKEAFRGGNTASNRYHTNIILDNVSSYDMSSAYPYVMISEQYPTGPFMEKLIESEDELEKYNDKYCTIGYYAFRNIEIKKSVPIPYLPLAKCSIKQDCKVYNGRILKAKLIRIALTNVDYKIIRSQYNIEEIYIEKFFFARKKYLSQELRNTVLEYFELKSKLKDVKGHEYEYMKSKNKLNSLYGMMVTAIEREKILFDPDIFIDGLGFAKGDKTTLEKYYKSRNSFLIYQQGIWVTCYCRKNLQQAIDKIGLDVVYCDTDSVKYLGNYDYVFEEINKEWLQKCKDNDIINSISVTNSQEKNKTYYLGLYDKEKPYHRFITLGAKKYAFEQFNDKNEIEIGITVAGLNKKTGAKELKQKGGLEYFRNYETFINSGRTTVYYNNDKIHYINVNNEKILTASNIALVNTTYTLGITDTMLSIIEQCFEEE